MLSTEERETQSSRSDSDGGIARALEGNLRAWEGACVRIISDIDGMTVLGGLVACLRIISSMESGGEYGCGGRSGGVTIRRVDSGVGSSDLSSGSYGSLNSGSSLYER